MFSKIFLPASELRNNTILSQKCYYLFFFQTRIVRNTDFRFVFCNKLQCVFLQRTNQQSIRYDYNLCIWKCLVYQLNIISQFLIEKKRFRDNMLFIIGINFGLRVSDLRTLRFSHLINDDCTFRDRFPILEKKTKNTRKHQRNRYISINTAVVEAVTLYRENTPGVHLSDYMFRSASNNGCNENKPISKQAVDAVLKGVAKDLGLGNRMATHSLRKTFAYHQMVMSGNDPRKLLLLQKMFGHSTAAQTLDYIGITSEEIDEAYRMLKLGSVQHNYLVDSDISEVEASLT